MQPAAWGWEQIKLKRKKLSKRRNAAAIIVYPSENWHATCKTVNVFCLYWHHMAVKNAERGERNPPYELRHHSKYSHTLR